MATERYDHNFPGYEILAQLGRGNARVLKARNQITGELVAIKHFALNTDAETMRRFQLESEIMTAVSHPNIVKIKEVRLDAELPYIVMDFIQGGDLRSLLKQQGTLDVATVVRLGVQIASAFKAIHEKGIIHRDIKPENIMFQQLATEELHFLLTDFGIAKLREQSNTVTGTSLMTYEYASPEQFDDFRSVTAAADYYSLGVVLYECLSGSVPFPLKGMAMVPFIRQVMNDPPPALVLKKGTFLPSELDILIKNLLSKKQENRLMDPVRLQRLLRRAELEEPAEIVETNRINQPVKEVKNVKPAASADEQKNIKTGKPEKRSSSKRRPVLFLITLFVLSIIVFRAALNRDRDNAINSSTQSNGGSVRDSIAKTDSANTAKSDSYRMDPLVTRRKNLPHVPKADTTVEYEEGSYTGQLRNGLPDGHGTFKWNNGHRYTGDWVLGKMEGKGSYYYMEGEYYDGDFKQNDKQGEGIYTWHSGDMYTGEWKDNKMDGFGTFMTGPGQSVSKCPGCRTYKGYWKEGLKEGFGQCYDENDRLLYMGNFKDDEPEEEYPNVDRSKNE